MLEINNNLTIYPDILGLFYFNKLFYLHNIIKVYGKTTIVPQQDNLNLIYYCQLKIMFFTVVTFQLLWCKIFRFLPDHHWSLEIIKLLNPSTIRYIITKTCRCKNMQKVHETTISFRLRMKKINKPVHDEIFSNIPFTYYVKFIWPLNSQINVTSLWRNNDTY